jgi:RsiW-degrading membrane proteinase PrsW (M82 family)
VIVLLVAILAGYVIAAEFLVGRVDPAGNAVVVALLTVVAVLVPAAAWLVFWYRQDQGTPEPLRMVLRVSAVSVVLAMAVGYPAVSGLFDVGAWLPQAGSLGFIGAFCIVAMTQETLKWVAVRFTAYESPVFGPGDGIIYGAAAGLGYATVLNATHVATALQQGSVELGLTAATVVITALAHSSFGGIVGYFLADQRFNARPVWWSALGVLIAAAINTLFYVVGESLAAGEAFGAVVSGRWIVLALATAVAGATSVVLWRLVRTGLEPARAARLTAQAVVQTTDTRREAFTVAVVLLLWVASLAVGYTLKFATENATRQVTQDEVSAAAPASWILEGPSGDLVLIARNPLRRDEAYTVSRLPQGAGTLDAAARENRVRAAAQREGLLIGDIESADLGGSPADRTAYSFVRRDAAGRPAVLDAVDYVVLSGSTVLVITFETPAETFERELPAFERFARSVRVSQP